MAEVYSKKCKNPWTRWDGHACVLCDLKPGYEVSPNCGYGDDSSKHETAFRKCKNGTFNDGSSASCHPCTVCPAGHFQLSPCNTTTDTQCSTPTPRNNSVEDKSDHGSATVLPITASQTKQHILWAVPLAVLCLVLVVAFWVKRKKRGQNSALDFPRRLSFASIGFSPLSAPASRTVETLDPAILSAPIQTILNDLDVVEDLMILLDPDTQGAKNTKHLASHCGFSSAWITYAYSMRDSKSPLKAVLEGITSRQPDWTVRDIVKMLRLMERNDAIDILARLRLGLVDV